MDQLCEICGERLYSYNSYAIEYDDSQMKVCQLCKQRFDDLLDTDSKNYEGSKKYFSSIENGRLYSCVEVNGVKVHYIKNRDNFDARDIKSIHENTLKLVNSNQVLTKTNNETIHMLTKINDNLTNINSKLTFFYYLAIISIFIAIVILFFGLIF